jgi:UDP-2-acetamido-3-amino-2,3-dideoxy-glucuronate N-acetyltransferase
MTDYFVHESSYVDERCQIGEGTKIWHFCHVMAGARIGRRCVIGQNVLVAPDVIVGDNVKIQNNVSLYTGVILEDDVFCGPSMVFTNVITPRSHVSRRHEYHQTLVTKDVPDFALVVGNPGRIAGWMCSCGVKLASTMSPPADAACGACGRRYRTDGAMLVSVGG